MTFRYRTKAQRKVSSTFPGDPIRESKLNLVLFQRSIEVCSEVFILNRMNSRTDEEEQAAKIAFGEAVFDEYFQRLEDQKFRMLQMQNEVRNLRARVKCKPTLQYQWALRGCHWWTPSSTLEPAAAT